MRETRADTRVAVVAAIVLHALLFALMFAGLWWTRTAVPVSAAGPVIEATSVTTVVFPGAIMAIALGWWADTRTDRPYAY